jgi:hypothetical protein
MLDESPPALEAEAESISVNNFEHKVSGQSVAATEGDVADVKLCTCGFPQLDSAQPGCDEDRATFSAPIVVAGKSQTKQPQIGGVRNTITGTACQSLLGLETSPKPEVFDPSSFQGAGTLCHLNDINLIPKDILHVCLHDAGDLYAPYELEEILDLCGDASLEDVVNGKGRAGFDRHVWLDAWNSTGNSGSGDGGKQENPMTSTGLLQALRHPRFEGSVLLTPTRRLIYIRDLDPYSILALAASTARPQALALRTAFHKHITFQPSIGATLTSLGCPIFNLELHLPFFLLRKTSVYGSSPASNTHNRERIQRRFTNLSFPGVGNLASGELGLYCISEVQFSCVVIGSDERCWTAYQFVDSKIETSIAGQSENGLDTSQILGRQFGAHVRVCRPSDYMLHILEIRIAQVRREWEYIVRKLGIWINQHVCYNMTNILEFRKISGNTNN